MMILKPHSGVGPIAFGMNSEEVATVIGNPYLSTKNRRGETVLRYDGFHITLSNQGVVEIESLPETNLSLGNIEIFSDPFALGKLCALDGDPQQCLGAVILMNLGIGLTGFHDVDESQKSVGAFIEGRFDILKPQMTTFSDFAA